MTNIAEILKDCPKGTELYSPIGGECELDCLCYGGDVITVVYKGKVKSNYTPSELYDELDRNYILCFDKYGRYKTTDRSDTNGEVMLFPSKNCRDWDAMMVKFVPNKTMIWHDSGEEPINGSEIIIVHDYFDRGFERAEIAHYSKGRFYTHRGFDYKWSDWAWKIKRWCYIEDILKFD